MTGNRALLMNFVEKFLGTVRFGNNVFAVIAGYGEEVSFYKDHVEKENIELYFVGTEYLLADLFTKSLPEARFKFLVEKL
nr:retrovirus-related Pol polyprotein from transposon TNT 1-94 [Tanacetum cinerariifolium]